MESFEASDPHKFHYGSHYSNGGVVLHYLLRMEPFVSLHVDLQGMRIHFNPVEGKFDLPDRLFGGLESCWKSINNSYTDVKELIPEFFYLPTFLKNEVEGFH
jgi:hypothetical protein